jgi:hypothetical protein
MKKCLVAVEEVESAASMSNESFRQAMGEINATLDVMAGLLGIARRLVADYRKTKPIPRSVALATQQLLTIKRSPP